MSGIGYDSNGNIHSMQRRGLVGLHQFGPLDRLSYAYQGNRLIAVDDELETKASSHDFEDNGKKFDGIKAEFGYDANGNLKYNSNKAIVGATYNHLNLPQLITFRDRGTMEFIYSAAGVKLRKIVRKAGKPDAVTDYSGGFVYLNDTLQFAHTPEGRVLFRPPGSLREWVYEYHYKDHLGNTRLAFRKQEHEVKIATIEPSRITDEQQDFDNIVETRSPERSYNGNYSSRLNAAENKPLGPVTMLPVQRGDSLTMFAFANYDVNSPAGKTWALAAFVSSLFNSAEPPPSGTEGYRNGRFTPYIGLALGASITALQTEAGVPNAYLKYIVLDQDSQYVYSDVKVIGSAASENWQELRLHYKVEQQGFVQVFVYNESGQQVFFDDLTIRKDPALIVQENHYDPWGLNLVGIEMQGRPDHKFQYNGKERQDELGLNWHDYGARMYDAQLGRWHVVDPMADHTNQTDKSPYQYGWNNPTNLTDPDGKCPDCPSQDDVINALVTDVLSVKHSLYNLVARPFGYEATFVKNQNGNYETGFVKSSDGFLKGSLKYGLDALSVATFGRGGGPNALLAKTPAASSLTSTAKNILKQFSRDGDLGGTVNLIEGNSKKGFQHILERHSADEFTNLEKGDLFPKGTTNQQIFNAIEQVYSKGTRTSDPKKAIQRFEKRIKMNGETENYRLIVDSKSKEVVTFFKMGGDQ